MPDQQPRRSLERSVHRSALALAWVVALSIPLAYCFVAYRDLADSLDFKARVKASTLSKLITSNPDTWMFAENRVQGLISREPIPLTNEQVEVRYQDQSLVALAGDSPPQPVLQRAYPLHDGGDVVGQIMLSGSMRPLLWYTLGSVLPRVDLSSQATHGQSSS